MVEDIQDPRRSEPSFLLQEREMLEAWLEFHRTTLLLKVRRSRRRPAQGATHRDIEVVLARSSAAHGRSGAQLVQPRAALAAGHSFDLVRPSS